MKPNVAVATRTSTLLAELINFASQGASVSITGPIDCSSVKLSDDAKYLIALAIFDGNKSKDALHILRNIPPYILKSLSYTFMLVCDGQTVIDLRTHTNLQYAIFETPSYFLVWVTGTLLDWYNAIIENTVNHRPYNFRLLMDKILLLFESKFGLGELWSHYQKQTLQDKTFILESE